MSVEEGAKENSTQVDIEVVSEEFGEPKSKQLKIEVSTLEPNLENLQNVTNISTEETIEENNTHVDAEVSGEIAAVTETELAEVEASAESACNVTNYSSSAEPTEECLQEKTHSISIKFHDEVASLQYKSKFINFLCSFPEFQVQNESDFVIHVYQDENAKSKEIDKTPLNKKRKKHSKAKKELFVVDSTPSENAHQADLRYETKFIVSSEKAIEGDNNGCVGQRNGCFNCGDQHSLKDCLVPKDYARIAMARQKFKFQYKSSRYHTDEQKYGHLEPGKISNELRKALGLQKNEVPHFVYLMRKLGYPPGWLEEAKFVHSNLDLFDIDGKNVKSTHIKKHGLDESKIVDYPGFNVPFPKGVKDDYRTYRVPPYSDGFSKKMMIGFFEKNFSLDHLEATEKNANPHQQCLEIKHELTLKPERSSPSLVDLEQQKQQLLEELNDEPKDEKKDSDYDSDKGFLAVKTSCFGTPLLKSSSPYSSLPNPDNFSKDVSPVINFENLPNSTGKYDQLTDVLQKVRDTLKKGNSS